METNILKMSNMNILDSELYSLFRLGHINRRSYNVLYRMGVNNVRDIVRLTRNELMCQRDCGVTTVRDILEFLGSKNLKLDMTDEEIAIYEREVIRKSLNERLEKEDFWVKLFCDAAIRVSPHVSGIFPISNEHIDDYADKSIRYAKILVSKLRQEFDDL